MAVIAVLGALAAGTWSVRADRGVGSIGKNVALGRPYRLDPPANYEGALGRKGTELTDGVLAGENFWVSGQSVGWSWHTMVTVDLELEEERPINLIRLQTGANTTVGINYPSMILAFGGDGAGPYGLLGASELHLDSGDPKKPATRMIDIRFAAQKVKRIIVVVFARGTLLYLSELAAYQTAEGVERPAELSSISEVKRAAIQHRRAAIDALPVEKPIGPDVARRWAMPLAKAGHDRSGILGCALHRVDPWEAWPADETIEAPYAAMLVALVGGRDYAAWRIVNHSDRAAQLTIAAEAKSGLDMRAFALAHVQALNFSWVPDVVVPFEEALVPPRSAMVLLAELQPTAAGTHDPRIIIRCAGNISISDIKVLALAADPAIRPLHGNLWSYLHEPPHRPIAGAIECASDFHHRFGVDTVVVHPEAIVDAGRGRPGNLLRYYLRSYKDAERLLLFMDIKSRPWGFLRLADDKAAAWLRDWWAWVEQNARATGVRGELLLYPLDEPSVAEAGLAARFRALLNRASINARTFVTVKEGDAAAFSDMDVVQVLRPTQEASTFRPGREAHLYATEPDGRLKSVQGYYRAQGWRAYELGYAGIGVWSAWASTGSADPASGWNPFAGIKEEDFGLVYSAPDGCGWPSRRLLAWRRGIEDNSILRHCATGMPDRGLIEVRQALSRGNANGMSRLIGDIAAGCGGKQRK